MSLWDWVAIIAPVAATITYYILSVRITGRPPADLYDALKDIAGGRK